MIVDLYLRNGQIVTENTVFHGGVLIRGEKIIGLIHGNQDIDAGEVVDLEGKVLMPGVVDSHVHFHDPGRDYMEGYQTGSMAAAAGGVTSVIDMPLNGIPPTIDVNKLNEKRKLIAGKSVVDYAHWAGLVKNNLPDMDALHKEGVVGFKVFMSGAATKEFTNVDDYILYAGLIKSKELGLLINVHAENVDIIDFLEKEFQHVGRVDREAWLESHPIWGELDAIKRVLYWTKVTGGQANITHVSIASGIHAVSEAKAQGVNVSVETCPHYLLFDENDYLRIGPEIKCDPPVRSREEVDAMWECVLKDQVDGICSDHAPCSVAEKEQGCDNIWKAWAGITGIQTMLLTMITEGVQKRGLPLSNLTRMMSANPARRLGLFPRKGSLSPGADADMVVIDMNKKWKLEADQLLSKNKHSAYIGQMYSARIECTYVRGKTVFSNGKIMVSPGFGKLLLADKLTLASKILIG